MNKFGSILAAIAAFQAHSIEAKGFTIPLEPMQVSKPVTPLQKQAAEYRKLTSTVEADVSLNPYEWLFLGPLYFGTPIAGATWAEPDVLQFIYDTSSDYVAVTSSNCGDLCIQQYYQPSLSSTYKSVSTATKTLSFSTPMFTGDTLTVDTVSDQVCLDLDGTTCVEDFVFYEIIDENVGSIIEDISGILGFSAGTTAQPSYLEALVTAGTIDAPVVTFNLNKDS